MDFQNIIENEKWSKILVATVMSKKFLDLVQNQKWSKSLQVATVMGKVSQYYRWWKMIKKPWKCYSNGQEFSNYYRKWLMKNDQKSLQSSTTVLSRKISKYYRMLWVWRVLLAGCVCHRGGGSWAATARLFRPPSPENFHYLIASRKKGKTANIGTAVFPKV